MFYLSVKVRLMALSAKKQGNTVETNTFKVLVQTASLVWRVEYRNQTLAAVSAWMWCYKTQARAADSFLCQTSRSWSAPHPLCSLWAHSQINPLIGPGAKMSCGPPFCSGTSFIYFLFSFVIFLHFLESTEHRPPGTKVTWFPSQFSGHVY